MEEKTNNGGMADGLADALTKMFANAKELTPNEAAKLFKVEVPTDFINHTHVDAHEDTDEDMISLPTNDLINILKLSFEINVKYIASLESMLGVKGLFGND
jgi:hypothetical protein